MSYFAIVTKLKDVRKHPNADRLQLATVFGNTVCVSMEYVEDQLGVYFPTDGQLSVEFATVNNLLRKKDENGNNIGGYMDPDKRNVTAIKLRGEKSDGLFLPLHCLESFGDITKLKEGDRIDLFNGHEICCKYVPRRNHRQGGVSEGNRTRKKKVDVAPLFVEHADTEQLAYNLSAFKSGDEIEITLKMHGTSQRTGYFPVLKGYKKAAKSLNDLCGRKFVQYRLHRWTTKFKTNGAELSRPHKEASLAQKTFIKVRRIKGIKLLSVNGDLFDSVNAEIVGLFSITLGEKSNQIKVIIGKHNRSRAQTMRNPFAIHAIILDTDFLVLCNTVYNFPKVVLYAFAIVIDFGIVVQFLANQLVHLGTIFRCGKLFQLVNQGQKLHF